MMLVTSAAPLTNPTAWRRHGMAIQDSTVKLCDCGCGRPTSLATRDDCRRGNIKGQPQRFVAGHSSKTMRRNVGNYRKRKSGGRIVAVHTLIATAALGKPLPKGVEVHHFDGNRHNNSNRNLVICESHSYHELLHVRARVLAAGGDPNTQRFCWKCKRLTDMKTDKPYRCHVCSDCQRALNKMHHQRNREYNNARRRERHAARRNEQLA